MLTKEVLEQRLRTIQETILQNCVDKNNPPQLIAVTKTVESPIINMLPQCGQYHIGENRAQAIVKKIDELDTNIKIHFIGRLQTNKIRYIIKCVSMIHSLDRENLAKELSKSALDNQISIPVLVQVNIANEQQKTGFTVQESLEFIQFANKYEGIKIKGLMAIMPDIDDELALAGYFKKMRYLFDSLKQRAFNCVDMDILSMGMSNDYKIALSEGSTMLRLGSILFR